MHTFFESFHAPKREKLRLFSRPMIAAGCLLSLSCGGGGGPSNTVSQPPTTSQPPTETPEEIIARQFGPVVPVATFKDLSEVSNYVVNAEFGQQLSIFGSDPEEVAALVDIAATQVGRINLNAQCQRGPDTFPFNGRKDSAEGTLSVSDALRQFSIRTVVSAKYNESTKTLLSEIIRNGNSNFLSTDFIF